MSTGSRSAARGQRGMALVVAILLMLVVSIMAVSMLRSYGVEEKIAGNTREKQRALNAAVSAQQYAEYWLSNSNIPATAACTAIVSSAIGQVCSLPLPNVASMPWTSGVTYTQFTSNPINGVTNTISAVGSQGTYYAAPLYYITDLGANKGAPAGEVYQIDAVGYGGTQNAVAVVESTYVISSSQANGTDSRGH